MPAISRPRERYGLPLTTPSATAVDHCITGIERLLAAEVGAEAALAQALVSDEDFVLAHAARALIAQVRGHADAAQPTMDQPLRAVAGLTRRERQHVEVMAAWVVGSIGAMCRCRARCRWRTTA